MTRFYLQLLINLQVEAGVKQCLMRLKSFVDAIPVFSFKVLVFSAMCFAVFAVNLLPSQTVRSNLLWIICIMAARPHARAPFGKIG